MSQVILRELKLNSAVKYVAREGFVNEFPITFAYDNPAQLQVFVGFKRVGEWDLQVLNGLPSVVLPEDLKLGQGIIIRRASPAEGVPHTYQYKGNAQGGAEFSAKTIDENFEYMSNLVSEVEDYNTIAQDNLSDMEEKFDVTQDIANEAIRVATDAKDTADNAEQVALGIDGKAQEALDNSVEALGVASDAKTTALGIDGKAQEALDKSTTAFQDASNALSIAQGIDGKAQEALDSASTALTVAQGIDGKAQDALDTAQSALDSIPTDYVKESDFNALSTIVDDKRDLDDNVFNGLMTIKSGNDEKGVGISLQESDGTVRGQVVATDQGLQLTQYPKDGGLQTFTFPTSGDGGEIVLKQDLANPDMGAAMVARSMVAVDSIADLLALPVEHRRDDLRYLVKGFYADNDLGGGLFYWDAGRQKADADGGVYIDPTALGGFDGSVGTLPEFLKAQGSGTGTGCWVRQLLDGKVRPSYFGYMSNNPDSGLVSVWASCRHGRRGTGVHFVLDEGDLVTSPTGSLPALGLGALQNGTSGGFIEGLDNLTIEIPSGKTWKLNGSFDFNFRPKGIGRYAGHKNLKIYGGGSFSGGTGRPFICFNLAHVTNVTVLDITFDECTNGHTFDVMGCTNLLFRDCKWIGSTLDFSTNRYNKEAIQFDVTGDGSRRIKIAEDEGYLDYVGNRHILIQDCQWKPKLNPDGSVSSYSVRPFGNHGSGQVDVDRDVVIEGCYIEAAHPAEGLYNKSNYLLEFNVIDGLVIRNNTIVLNHCPYYGVIYFRESESGLLYDKSTNSLLTVPMPTRLPCPKVEGNHIEYNISGRIQGEVGATKLIMGTGVHILNNTINTNISAEESEDRHAETPALYRMLPGTSYLNYLNEVIIRGNKVHGVIRDFGGLTNELPQGLPMLEIYEIADNFFEMPSTSTHIVAKSRAINVVNNYIGLSAWNYGTGASIFVTLNGEFVRVTGNTVGPKRQGETLDNYFVREGGVSDSMNVIISENVSADSILQNYDRAYIKKYNNYNIGDADMLVDQLAELEVPEP